MENYKKNAIRFLVNLSLKEEKDPRVVKYDGAKTKTSGAEARYFPRLIGGEGGKYATHLTSLLHDLEKEERANVHNIAIWKDGAIILEASAEGYSTNVFHLAHSMSKTVTGLAIGMLFDESKIDLDARAIDFFPEIKTTNEMARSITVRDLLGMRSGVKFAELGAISEDDWCRAFFESEMEFVPGDSFKYNSMNSYILAEILTRVTGTSLTEYLKPRLFDPLEITNYLWETSPHGVEKGGFGLYLSCESFLKIGVMMTAGGYFNGKRVISEKFLSTMLTASADATKEGGDFDYGLHVWVGRSEGEFLLNGMLGQNVWISGASGFVVSMNCGNNELFTESPALAIVKKHICGISRIENADKRSVKLLRESSEKFFTSRAAVTTLKEKRTLSTFCGIKPRRPFDTRWDLLLGEYAFRDNNASILPLFVRTLQNNFTGGMEKIRFFKEGESLYLCVTEGGVDYKLEVGLYGYNDSVLKFNTETYIIRSRAECSLDVNRNHIYRIELIFPELPNSRMLEISHVSGGIRIDLTENPNDKIAETFFDTLLESKKAAFAIGFIENKMGRGFLKRKIHETFNPTLEAISTKAHGWESILANDNARLSEEREESSKFINSLISKFLSDEEKPKQAEGGLKGFFAKAISLLFEKLQPEPTKDVQHTGEIIEIDDNVVTFLDAEDQ